MYPFRYCTVKDARAYSRLENDEREILTRIELWSTVINEFTGMWFTPVYYDGMIKQMYDDVFCFPNKVPVIEMSAPVEVAFSPMGGVERVPYTTTLIDTTVGSYLAGYSGSLLYSQVAVDGYFGWLQHNRSKIATTVSSAVAVGATQIPVASNAGIVPGDVVLADGWVTAIVCEICNDGSLGVDPIADSIPQDAPLVVFGKINPQISFCVKELIAKKGFGTAEQSQLRFQQMLVSETTDSYTYRLAEPGRIDGTYYGTGIAEVDSMLMRFKPMTDVRLI